MTRLVRHADERSTCVHRSPSPAPKPPVSSTHLEALGRARGQRPSRLRGVVERACSSARGKLRNCILLAAVGPGTQKRRGMWADSATSGSKGPRSGPGFAVWPARGRLQGRTGANSVGASRFRKTIARGAALRRNGIFSICSGRCPGAPLLPRSLRRAASERIDLSGEEPMPRCRRRFPPDPAWPPARKAQLRRNVWKKMRKFRNSKEFAYLEARDAARAKQKAPGLATGGSSSSED